MQYAAAILDLDGVVYIGAEAVPFSIDSLNALAARGTVLTAATNNANRPAEDVAQHLQALGLDITASAVMTSAQAAARHLAQILLPGAKVLAVGGEGVASSLLDVGLVPLRAVEDLAENSSLADLAEAVLVGYGPKVAWFDLATAHWAIERGKPWFATNTDPTVPLPYGRAPGNGAMVGLLHRSTNVEPTVIGKPQPALFDALAAELGTRNALVIGDRLDTDIDGAIAANMDSLLVLTGVHGPSDLAARSTATWPGFIAQDLRSLESQVIRLRREGGRVVADSTHPLARALECAAAGDTPNMDSRTAEASPLFDARGI